MVCLDLRALVYGILAGQDHLLLEHDYHGWLWNNQLHN